MKLAKKLSTITLASIMVVSSIPVTVLADEEVPAANMTVEEVAVEEVSTEEIVPESQAVSKEDMTPVLQVPLTDEAEVETVEAVDTKAVNNQQAVDDAKKAVQDAIDAVEIDKKVQKDYTYKSWYNLQKAIQSGEILLTATFNNGAAQMFTYIDINGEVQTKSEEGYIQELENVKNDITSSNSNMAERNIRGFSELIDKVSKLNSDDYQNLEIDGEFLGLRGSNTLADVVAKAQDMLRTLLLDERDDDLFSSIDQMKTYLKHVSSEDRKSFRVQLSEAIAKAEEVVPNKKANYTLKSYNALVKALNTAKVKLEGTDAINESDVTPLIDRTGHGGAYEQLVDLEPIQLELAKAVKLSNENKDYTASSWKVSQKHIKEVKDNLNRALTEANFEYSTVGTTPIEEAKKVFNAATVNKGSEDGTELISIKELKESRAKVTAPEGEEADYTPSSFERYTNAISMADLILTQADDTAYSIQYGTVWQTLSGINGYVLGMAENPITHEWEPSEVNGLVNIKEAKALVAEHEDLWEITDQDNVTDYLLDSNWQTYVDKAKELKERITTNESTATRKNVKEAIDTVKEAKAKLTCVNKKSFSQMIAKAEAVIAHKDVYKEVPNRETVFKALEKAVAEAKQVTMPSADAIKALDDAVKATQTLPKIDNVEALDTAIADAQAVWDAHAEELMPSSKEAFEANLKEAKALRDAYETDENQLAAATAALNIAEKEYTSEYGDVIVGYGNYVVASKFALKQYAEEVKQIPSSSYTNEAYEQLITKWNKAFNITNSLTALQDEVIEAYEELRAAVAHTTNNSQSLNDLYNQVKDYDINMFEGAEGDTPWSDFKTARTTAKNTLTSTDVKAVSEAYTDLKAKLEALTAVNKTTLKKAIDDEMKGKDEYSYTVASWTALQDVIKDAQALLNGTKEASADIKTMQMDKFPTAVSNLVVYGSANLEESVNALLGVNGYYVFDSAADDYTEESWLAYKAVRDDFAEKLLDVTDTTAAANGTKVAKYENRTETLANLQRALVNAKKALVRVNGATLEKLVADADKLVEKEYTAETWKAFADALKDAKAALEDGTPSLMVKAEKTLRAAMTALKKDEAKTPAAFTKDLFRKVIGREATDADVEFYTNAIEKDGWTAAQLVQHFTTTPEFTGKNLSDTDFIKAIYEMGLNRAADAEGLAYWMGELANSDRKVVMARILDSKEFGDYCETVGMTKGAVSVAPAAENFIKGLYTACFGRSAAQAEVLAWLPQLTGKKMTGSALAKFFVKSPEFTGKTMTDTEYITALYKAFFGGVDEAGVNYWVGQIKDGAYTRDTALNFFAGSDQFKGICAAAGIEL